MFELKKKKDNIIEEGRLQINWKYAVWKEEEPPLPFHCFSYDLCYSSIVAELFQKRVEHWRRARGI